MINYKGRGRYPGSMVMYTKENSTMVFKKGMLNMKLNGSSMK